MLKQLDVTTRRGTTLVLEMIENDSGYQIADIQGLEPVKANLVSTGVAGLDGAQFQAASRVPRNIKLILDLEPDWATDTYTTLRHKLYSYFMPKSTVTLRFHRSTGLYVDILGIVETMSAPSFEQDPQVEISLMCFQPDFIDPRTVTLDGFTVSDGTLTEIEYPGTVDTGTILTLHVNRPLTDFTIYTTGEDGVLHQLNFSGDLENEDLLIISSVRGSKGITLVRAGVTSSYLYGRTAQSSWIELMEGVNEFRVYAPGDPVPYELTYSVRYGGL